MPPPPERRPLPRLDAEGFVREVVRSDVPVIVEFYADWCVNCLRMEPILEELAELWEGAARFFAVDVQRYLEIARALGIRSIPVVARFEHGEPVAFTVGFRWHGTLERELGLHPEGERRRRWLSGRHKEATPPAATA